MKSAVIILAAGKGTRMKSDIAKIFHEIGGQPMLNYVLDAVSQAGVGSIYVVVGRQAKKAERFFKGHPIKFVHQLRQLGTGHAVKMAAKHLAGFDGNILVLNGDTPLITSQTLRHLIGAHGEGNAAATVLTAEVADPTGYGRVIRGEHGTVTSIVEQKDASTKEQSVCEINTGSYCFKAKDLFWALARLKNENAQKEYYLTDTVSILKNRGKSVIACMTEDPSEVIGINTRMDLAEAEKVLQQRTMRRLMEEGVTIIDPPTTFVDPVAIIGRDTVLYPFTFIKGHSVIGKRCHIGPHANLADVTVGNQVLVKHSEISKSRLNNLSEIVHSVVSESTIPRKKSIGPFQYIGA